jgi:hypothetical protein
MGTRVQDRGYETGACMKYILRKGSNDEISIGRQLRLGTSPEDLEGFHGRV